MRRMQEREMGENKKGLKITVIVAVATAVVYAMGKLVNGHESREDDDLGGLGLDDTDIGTYIDPYGVKFVPPFYESRFINDPVVEISQSEFESIVNDLQDYGANAPDILGESIKEKIGEHIRRGEI